MFFILPVAVDYQARRYPVVTFTLMGLNTALYLVALAILFALAVGAPAFYALGCCATIFATEREENTFDFLRTLPSRPGRLRPGWPAEAGAGPRDPSPASGEPRPRRSAATA